MTENTYRNLAFGIIDVGEYVIREGLTSRVVKFGVFAVNIPQ